MSRVSKMYSDMRFIKSNGKQLRNELQKFPEYYYHTFSLSRILVAGLVNNNSIVGVCCILGMSNYVAIYIDEAYRGQGLGTQILKKTVIVAKKQGLVFLTTSMSLNNEPSMRLFQKLDWFGNVIDRKYANLNPTNLLLWRTIQFGMKSNFRVFDLGQTRKNERGVYHFKSGWGGSETNLEDNIFSPRDVKLPNPDERKYVLLSRIWSRMPRSLARRFGPKVIAGIAL